VLLQLHIAPATTIPEIPYLPGTRSPALCWGHAFSSRQACCNRCGGGRSHGCVREPWGCPGLCIVRAALRRRSWRPLHQSSPGKERRAARSGSVNARLPARIEVPAFGISAAVAGKPTHWSSIGGRALMHVAAAIRCRKAMRRGCSFQFASPALDPRAASLRIRLAARV
jgi:hypothetical protein